MGDVRPYPRELIERYRGIWLGTTMIDAFERTCDIIPDKEAVVEGDDRLTFAELRERVQDAARAFVKLGLGHLCWALSVPYPR